MPEHLPFVVECQTDRKLGYGGIEGLNHRSRQTTSRPSRPAMPMLAFAPELNSR